MGKDNFNAGALIAFMWIGTIILSIGSGIYSWNWVHPKSFLGAIGFLILWSILSKVGHFIMFGVVFTLFGRD